MKTKRLLALTLALVLALGVWPMVALGAADSNHYFGWKTDGTFAALTGDTGGNTPAWTDVTTGTSDFTGNKGILVVKDTASGAMDLSAASNIGGTTLIINHAATLTIADSVTVTAGDVFTIGTGKIVLAGDNSQLVTSNGTFKGQMTITRKDTTKTDADISTAPAGTTFTVGNDVISAVGGNIEITDYEQSPGSSLTSGYNVTFKKVGSDPNILNGTVAMSGTSKELIVDNGTSAVLTLNTVPTFDDTSFINVGTNGTLNIGSGVTLDLNRNTHALGGKLNVFGNLTLTDTTATVGGATVVKNGGTLTIGESTTFATTLTVDSTGELFVNSGTTTVTDALTVTGTATVATGATLKLGANSEVSGTVNALATDSKLELNGKNLSVTSTGYLNFEMLGTLSNQSSSTDSTVTLNGRMRMYDPVATPDNFQIDKGTHTIIITGTGTLSTNNKAGFGNYAMTGINFVPYYTPQPSYADTLISNTPVMAPANTDYPGYGVFVIASTGFFNDFDPDRSLYANGVKMEVGVDYDVVNKGGYAQFNIYESFMQTLNGPVVFKATFISGKVSSATVSVQGVAIPDDITATAPKTGDNGSMLGVAVMLMAVAMAAVVKRVRA